MLYLQRIIFLATEHIKMISSFYPIIINFMKITCSARHPYCGKGYSHKNDL